MSERPNLTISDQKSIRRWKIVCWALVGAVAAYLMFDGKTRSTKWPFHLLLGAAVGWFLGFLFSPSLPSSHGSK
jgi:hypothetical protein